MESLKVTFAIKHCEDHTHSLTADIERFVEEQRSRGFVVTEYALGRKKTKTGYDLPRPVEYADKPTPGSADESDVTSGGVSQKAPQEAEAAPAGDEAEEAAPDDTEPAAE